MAYPPQYGHYPPQPVYPPKKKSKAGLWITLAAVVIVLLGGVAFTGFVAPGFLVKKPDTMSRGTPEQLAASFANTISTRSPYLQLICQVRSNRTDTAIRELGVLDGDVGLNGLQATNAQEQAAFLTVDGRKFGFAMIELQGQWCIRDIKHDALPPALASVSDQPEPRPPLKQPEAVTQYFVDAVNKRDIPKMFAVLCSDVIDAMRENYQIFVYGEPQLTVIGTETQYGGGKITKLDELIDGKRRNGTVRLDESASPGPCVHSFDQ